MKDINKVILIGRLTKDFELVYLQSGKAKGEFTIASNDIKKNADKWEDVVNFFDCELFGKSAENLKPYLNKGQQVAIEGKLKQDRWEKDGQKNSKTKILIENIQLVGRMTNASAVQPSENKSGFQPLSRFPEDTPF